MSQETISDSIIFLEDHSFSDENEKVRSVLIRLAAEATA
jgi:hypothetical protein